MTTETRIQIVPKAEKLDINLLRSNCTDKKNDLSARFDVVKFGTCNHPTAIDAEAYAYTVLLTQLSVEGAVFGVEVGSVTVSNGLGFNTFLSYAGGNTGG